MKYTFIIILFIFLSSFKLDQTKDYDMYEPLNRCDQIAFTFDDGPNKKDTPRILDILKKNDIKATFFVNGINVEKNPEIAKRIIEEGHELGIHGYEHKMLTKLSDQEIIEEIQKDLDIIKKIAPDYEVKTFRPAYFGYSTFVDKVIKKNFNLAVIMASIDSIDYRNGVSQKILKNIVNWKLDGGIVLFHDGPNNKDRSELIKYLSNNIPILKKKYKFIRISDEKKNQKKQKCYEW